MNSEPFDISRFIRLQGDNLLMRRGDGSAKWIPLSELSVGEQILVRRCHDRSPGRKRQLAAQKKKASGYSGYNPFKTRRESINGKKSNRNKG
ncbi:MAG: hypothetical protein P1V20_11390 [Verrucomicrobiales bacterium]|nr:hypothetical protein [Verrucomicrobiales bacterium]